MALQSQQFMTDLKVNMLTDTVDIRVTPSLNSYGERSFTGGATTYSAYVRRVEQADRTADLDLQNVDYICYIPDASLTLDVDGALPLPEGKSLVFRATARRRINSAAAWPILREYLPAHVATGETTIGITALKRAVMDSQLTGQTAKAWQDVMSRL